MRTDTTVAIRAFDPQTATAAEWTALNDLRNALQAERLPDDPPRTVADRQAQIRELPSQFGMRLWGAWAGETMVGMADIILFRGGENEHVAQLEGGVLPAWRRQGVGRRLLGAAAGGAAEEGRRLLVAESFGAVPAGAAFLTRAGASIAIESHINQLELATLDPALLDRWQVAVAERAPGYTLGWWEIPYPEDDLTAIAALREAGNLQPLGDLEINDFHWTPDQLRQMDAYYQARGEQRWTAYVRAPETGELAGFTEINWKRDRPSVLMQGFTAVWPAHRGRGLGRWLKAAMLARVLREVPGARFVRTDNADTNAPMLKINEDLGFRPYQSDHGWKITVAQVAAYLAGN